MCDYDYQEYIDMIDEMLLDETYEFATEMLLNIRDWVDEHKSITEKQVTAIENIKNSGTKYDGFIDKYV